MNIEELMERGGFVPPELVKTSVTWDEADGGPVTFDIYIKQPSAADVDRSARALAADVGTGANFMENFAPRPALVASMVYMDPEGKRGFTYVQACNLKDSLCSVLFKAAHEVSKTAQAAAKNSVPATNSGASSSQAALVDAQ